MHQLADSLNGEDQYAVAIVSLFGVQSIEELDKKVKEAILYVRTINKSENDSSSKVFGRDLGESMRLFQLIYMTFLI